MGTWTRTSREPGGGRSARALLCLAVAVLALVCLCSCRPTDLFTEVVITPFAENVDENNENKTVVNSPDASKDSNDLAALDWKSNAKQSKNVQNLVTYSKKPTTTLSTHHSVFDLDPRFPGVKSSDKVRLDFATNSKIRKKKSSEPQESDNSAENTQLKGSEGTSESASSKNSGASSNGKEKKDSSKAAGKGEGTSEKKDGGYGGKVQVYDPNNALEDPPKADHVAAIGQAAVLVQGIGGAGKLCAMDAQTYGTRRASGLPTFKSVFSGKLSKTKVLWSGAGTTPASLSDVDELVSACGKDGVIVYDQQQVNPNKGWFDSKQRAALNKAGITFVPVSLGSLEDLRDASTAVGKVLSRTEQARAYYDAVKSVSDAARDAQVGGSSKVWTCIATEYETLSWSGPRLSKRFGVLFTRVDGGTPLSEWASAALGSNSLRTVDSSSDAEYAALWGIRYGAPYKKSSFSGSSGLVRSSTDEAIQLIAGTSANSSVTNTTFPSIGLGSAQFPYLIVSDSDTSSKAVKSQVVSEIESYPGRVTPYTAFPGNGPNRNFLSCVGSDGETSENVFADRGENASDYVYANPSGLLGSWTGSSVESVLESVWLSNVYSTTRGLYTDAVCDLSRSELEKQVKSFYKAAYDGYEISDATLARLLGDGGGD